MVFGAALLVAGAPGASASADKPAVSARAFAVRIAVPGQPLAGTEAVAAPGDAVSFGSSFAYPASAPLVTTGAVTASALTSTGATVTGQASSEVNGLSLFGGEVTAVRVAARAKAVSRPRSGSRDFGGSAVSGLSLLGQPVTASPNLELPLGDWGSAAVLRQAGPAGGSRGSRSQRASVSALEITLTADHAGLPAGTRVIVAHAEAGAEALPIPRVSPTTTATSAPTTAAPASNRSRPASRAKPSRQGRAVPRRIVRQPKAPDPERSPYGAPPVRRPPSGLTPRLTAGGYVFPVYGPSSFTDTFGAPRASVVWHHGGDIFASLGAPVLAVTDGIAFSVGWNDIGGNRLWLRDQQGNQFYYAHLSAFSPLAVNGARIQAGDVLGFVGDTGDAAGTPYHLHFEIHPKALLGLGYDGVVNPTSYLLAWRHVQDLDLSSARLDRDDLAGYARSTDEDSAAPRPGAFLLHASDISSASGLDPGSLRSALADPAFGEGDGSFLARAGSPGQRTARSTAPVAR